MIITRIKAKNYKTYLDLNLDLSVKDEHPIVLIGGLNGGGKTTLFEAICGTLYGLDLKTKHQFEELLNNGAVGKVKPSIELELTFTGQVLDQEKTYILKRTYMLNDSGKPVESVDLNMDGNHFVYGTASRRDDRQKAAQIINKIIKANLPKELSNYFLFDAMQSSNLIKANVFAQVIKDNIENVLGFNKYLQLQRAAEKLQQEKAQDRIDAENERQEYAGICAEKEKKESELQSLIEEEDKAERYLTTNKEDYEKARQGNRDMAVTKQKMNDLESRIKDVEKSVSSYYDDATKFMKLEIESNLFWSELARNINLEVGEIVRSKNSRVDNYSPEKVREIACRIIEYLQQNNLVASQIEEDKVVDFVIKKQTSNPDTNSYDFLDDDDVRALSELVNIRSVNNYISINRRKRDLELQLDNLPIWESQVQTLRTQLKEGNEALIKEYSEKEYRLNQIAREKDEKRGEIAALAARLRKFDINIREEPDPRYDTLAKLSPFFAEVANELLKRKKELIQKQMLEQLNKLLLSYKDQIARVEIGDTMENFTIKLFHKAGNEISLGQLNTASKQIFIQVLLKVLRNLGDYNPPVMIDTVMGVLDEESRESLMELYFPQLAEQTILLSTSSEIRKDSDYKKLEPFISRTYTLHRDVKKQSTFVSNDYFGIKLEE